MTWYWLVSMPVTWRFIFLKTKLSLLEWKFVVIYARYWEFELPVLFLQDKRHGFDLQKNYEVAILDSALDH